LRRFGRLREGLAAQVLHEGPFENDGPTVERLHGFVRDEGYGPAGKHQEIYLGDLRRTGPERQHTVIPQPVA
jgi:hypothetical protein